jgi:ankyrin repeat protein
VFAAVLHCDSFSELSRACTGGDLREVEGLLGSTSNEEFVTDDTPLTPLMHAIAGNHSDVLDLLLNHSSSWHRSTNIGQTTLLFCSREGSICRPRNCSTSCIIARTPDVLELLLGYCQTKDLSQRTRLETQPNTPRLRPTSIRFAVSC